jgi:Pectate lyase superfamily protein
MKVSNINRMGARPSPKPRLLALGRQVSRTLVLLAFCSSLFSQSYLYPSAQAVVRPIADKLADTMSVKDFGARGDGVTDDTSSLRAAISAAQSAQRSLYVPAGTYVFRGLILAGGVDVYGDGAPLYSVLKYVGQGTALRIENAGGRLRNLTITSANPAAIGIDFFAVSEMYLDHVEVGTNGTSKFGIGVRLAESGGTVLEHYVSSWNDVGVLLDAGKSANAHIVVQNSNFFGQSVAAVQIREGTAVYIEKSWMEAFQNGILLDNSDGIVCANSIFIRNNSMVSSKAGALAVNVNGTNRQHGIYAYNFQFEGNKAIQGGGAHNIELRFSGAASDSIGKFGFRNNLFSGATAAAVYGDATLLQVYSENDMTDPFATSYPMFSPGLSATTIKPGLLQLGSREAGDCSEQTRGTIGYEAGTAGQKDTLRVCVKNESDTFAWEVLR